jgi:amidase
MPKASSAFSATILAVLMTASLPAQSAPTAESATKAAIARIQAVDPQIHAVIALDPTALDQARAIDLRNKDRATKARGLLYGYSVLIKDNIESDGPLPTTAGSLALLDNVTHRDAPIVTKLRAADAVILGKTNLSEWANIRSNASISGWSGVGGQTRNPYALDRDPCGSSSGSGAAVAAGEVKAAIGTETDGSLVSDLEHQPFSQHIGGPGQRFERYCCIVWIEQPVQLRPARPQLLRHS